MLRQLTLALILAAAAVSTTGCTVTVQEGTVARSRVRWRNEGWVKLGERMVNGRGVDRDTVTVGRDDGRFRKVMLVVEASSLEMYDMDIEFGDGSHYSPPLRAVFGKNSSSQVIDLPGDARVIRKVVFHYRNLPGGGNANVELWGRR